MEILINRLLICTYFLKFSKSCIYKWGKWYNHNDKKKFFFSGGSINCSFNSTNIETKREILMQLSIHYLE